MCPYYLDGDLINDVIGDTRFIGYCAVFKVRGEGAAFKSRLWQSQADETGEGRSLKTQQHVCSSTRARGSDVLHDQVSVDVLVPIDKRSDAFVRRLPRKEVIQPQLPLRLPCYDFTPVTSPTFDGSLPCGLGHRLRVLLTPVV